MVSIENAFDNSYKYRYINQIVMECTMCQGFLSYYTYYKEKDNV